MRPSDSKVVIVFFAIGLGLARRDALAQGYSATDGLLANDSR
jgi:hypothetical protein